MDISQYRSSISEFFELTRWYELIGLSYDDANDLNPILTIKAFQIKEGHTSCFGRDTPLYPLSSSSKLCESKGCSFEEICNSYRLYSENGELDQGNISRNQIIEIRDIQISQGYTPCFCQEQPLKINNNDHLRCSEKKCEWLGLCNQYRDTIYRSDKLLALVDKKVEEKSYEKLISKPNELSHEFTDEDLKQKEQFYIELDDPYSRRFLQPITNPFTHYYTAPVSDYSHALSEMESFVSSRVRQPETDKNNITTIIYPVALIFYRYPTDSMLLNNVMRSYEYWNWESSNDIDLLFPGWLPSSNVQDIGNVKLEFNLELFINFKSQIESISKWRYSGETDILLLNYEYDCEKRKGVFRFNRTITLCVEKLIREKQIGSIDEFMQRLIGVARVAPTKDVWEISNNIGIQVFRRTLWQYVTNKLLGGVTKIYDDLRPFAICNLEL